MNIKKTIKNALLTAATAVMLYAPVQANSIAVEASKNGALVDAKTNGNITEKVGYFNRNKIFLDYKNNGGFFSLTDISYGLGKGFSILGEAWLSDKGILPRLGASYFGRFGNFSLYTAHTISPFDYCAFIKPSYAKKLGKLEFVVVSENLAGFDKDGFGSWKSTNKLGVKKGKYAVGATNTTTLDNQLEVSNNPGGFLQVDF
jgi:hypothetical protein